MIIKLDAPEFIYDSRANLYIARGLLTAKRALQSLTPNGVEFSEPDKPVNVTSLREVTKLISNLPAHPSISALFPDAQSRILNYEEYLRYFNWAKQYDSQLLESMTKSFEVLSDTKPGKYVLSTADYDEVTFESVDENTIADSGLLKMLKGVREAVQIN